jgi:hypothetical protein
MDITIKLSDREVKFLQKLIDEQKSISHNNYSMEDAIHECIRDSMFDEGEAFAQEEFEK